MQLVKLLFLADVINLCISKTHNNILSKLYHYSRRPTTCKYL